MYKLLLRCRSSLCSLGRVGGQGGSLEKSSGTCDEALTCMKGELDDLKLFPCERQRPRPGKIACAQDVECDVFLAS